jgi:hypothetical protein
MKNCLTSVFMGSLLALGILTGCEKKTDTDYIVSPPDFMNLQVGKYVRYLLDSTRFIAFGQKDTVVSYQAKDVVDAAITDNLGRESYRIIRYLRDVNSTNDADWRPSLTYMVTPTRGFLEVVENNLRYVKMAMPLAEGFTWRGNRFLPDDTYKDLFPFSNDANIEDWDYTYQDVGVTLNINNVDYDSTLTVFQIDESKVVPNGPGFENYWTEKYARNIGLVYKEVRMWEQQPPDTTGAGGYRHGFGIKMTILDHN